MCNVGLLGGPRSINTTKKMLSQVSQTFLKCILSDWTLNMPWNVFGPRLSVGHL